MKRVCVITDNDFLYSQVKHIVAADLYKGYRFDYFFSQGNVEFEKKYKNDSSFKALDLKKMTRQFYNQYIVFFSIHCKQIFPTELINNYRCINVHPGYNPYNRGWFPQVFSILNKKPIGVTIHEMDSKLDHGAIIYQAQIAVDEYDTSYSVYQKIQKLEVELLKQNLSCLLKGDYQVQEMASEGNINYKRDFEELCKIDLNKKATYGEVIDFLRAMTFDKYNNAYFMDKKGNKVYVSITLIKENMCKNDKSS